MITVEQAAQLAAAVAAYHAGLIAGGLEPEFAKTLTEDFASTLVYELLHPEAK